MTITLPQSPQCWVQKSLVTFPAHRGPHAYPCCNIMEGVTGQGRKEPGERAESISTQPWHCRIWGGGGMVTKLLGSGAPVCEGLWGVVLRPAGLFYSELCLGGLLAPWRCAHVQCAQGVGPPCHSSPPSPGPPVHLVSPPSPPHSFPSLLPLSCLHFRSSGK